MKKIFILGATGSIGGSTLHCLKALQENKDYETKFEITGISFNENIEKAKKILSDFSIKNVVTHQEKAYFEIKKEFPQVKVYFNIEEALKENDFDILVNGISGSAGLLPTITAIKKKAKILLANKETLVIAGEMINELLKKYQTSIIPLDSEHAAIFQLLLKHNINEKNLKKIILTASGGPFFKSHEENPSLEQALKHPNWKMGKKITIDSATMMNKGLEVIEAHFLFNLSYDKIETIIHPESIIHSFILTSDNTHYAQLGSPDMKHPIHNALTHPEIIANDFSPYDLTNKKLTFHEVDYEKFPLLKLAYDCGRKGGSTLIVMNAANEMAVHLFLQKKISYRQIHLIIAEEVNEHQKLKEPEKPSLNEIIALDLAVKSKIKSKFG